MWFCDGPESIADSHKELLTDGVNPFTLPVLCHYCGTVYELLSLKSSKNDSPQTGMIVFDVHI